MGIPHGQSIGNIVAVGGTLVSGKIPTTAAGGGSNVAVTNVSGDVRVTSANLPLTVSAAGITRVSGQIKTTAVGVAGGDAVSITNVSGTLPVSGHMRAQVETSAPADVNELAFGNLRMTSARGLHVAQQGAIVVSGEVSLRGVSVVNPGGGVNIASSALAVNIATPGTNIGISAAALPQQDVSAHAAITNIGPLTDVCGVNRTGSALNVYLAGTSAQVHVTAGDLPVPVSQNAPLAWETGLRGDAIYNAAVSNPVKYGKLAQVAGAVCADIVPAVAARRIRVLGGYFNSTGTATAIFMSTGASAAYTGKIVIYGGFVLPPNPYGWFETAVGSALSIQIEGGSVGGLITYQEAF